MAKANSKAPAPLVFRARRGIFTALVTPERAFVKAWASTGRRFSYHQSDQLVLGTHDSCCSHGNARKRTYTQTESNLYAAIRVCVCDHIQYHCTDCTEVFCAPAFRNQGVSCIPSFSQLLPSACQAVVPKSVWRFCCAAG